MVTLTERVENIVRKYIAKTAVVVFCFVQICFAQSDLTLQKYNITIDPVDLTNLYSNPYSNDYYEAQLTIDETVIDCEIRFRGASARTLPKKSWKLKFPNNDNVFNAQKINFNAEYRDASVMRNYLTAKLFEYFNEPAPQITFINLFINGDYYGVFSQIEELEEDFLNRNYIRKGSVYKARSHSANFAPIAEYNRYMHPWDKQVGDKNNYNDIIRLLNKLMFYTPEELRNNIEDDIDLLNIINYFAIEFVIVGYDSFTKNYNLYLDKDGQNAKLFPWDNDATLGNHWSGSFRNDYIYNIDGNQDQNWECLRFNVLFQKLMEYENYRSLFHNRINEVITSGFDYLKNVMDSTYTLISNDMYQDTKKGYTNEQFDDSKNKLFQFINGRKQFLTGKELFDRPRIENIIVSNSFPNSNDVVIFEVELNRPAEVFLDYVLDYDLANGGSNFNVSTKQLFDDGMFQDADASDLVYGTNLYFPNNSGKMIPYAFRINDTYYPANGFSYYGYGPTVTYGVNPGNSEVDFSNSLKVLSVYNYLNDQIIVLENRGDKNIDLSYFHLRGKNVYDDFVIPPGVNLLAGSKLNITTNLDLTDYVFPGVLSLEKLPYSLETGDTIKIYSPAINLLNEFIIEDLSQLALNAGEIFINEINYHSSDTNNTGDWIELYNSADYSVSLRDWVFKDSDDEHVYTFPRSAIIESHGFFVLCQDVELFKSINSDVQAMGSFDFGLSNGGELLRLYNNENILEIEVTYVDESPWPAEADGNGFTLELKNSELDYQNPESWSASTIIGGTPGKKNSNNIVADVEGKTEILDGYKLYQNYPNPFNPTTTIYYSLPESSLVSFLVYDILGREVVRLVDGEEQEPGSYSVVFDGSTLSSGLYFYKFETQYFTTVRKMLLMK